MIVKKTALIAIPTIALAVIVASGNAQATNLVPMVASRPPTALASSSKSGQSRLSTTATGWTSTE